METQVIIVGHHERIGWIAQLQAALPGASAVVDYAGHGALWGHMRALEIAKATGERCVIVEDDAIPVEGFTEMVGQWCERFPDDLISFYLGTGRPREWQAAVDRQLETAYDYITLPKLIHGVCYSLPPGGAEFVLKRIAAMGRTFEGADYVIGRAWGRQVVYPVESLVEHRDGPSVEKHPDCEPRSDRRVARCLAGNLMYER